MGCGRRCTHERRFFTRLWGLRRPRAAAVPRPAARNRARPRHAARRTGAVHAGRLDPDLPAVHRRRAGPCGAYARGARGDRVAEYKGLTITALEETLPFRRWALICAGAGDAANQAEALLQAAWAADDAAAMTEAQHLREQVAALWADTTDIETGLRRLDVAAPSRRLRRCGAWADALTARTQEPTATAIITFQRGRIALRDVGRHLISSAMPPPSHAPHVSHGKRATTGFWSRLLRK